MKDNEKKITQWDIQGGRGGGGGGKCYQGGRRGMVDATTALRIFENVEKEIFLYAARTFNKLLDIYNIHFHGGFNMPTVCL